MSSMISESTNRAGTASLVEGLRAALDQFEEPMSALTIAERGERLAGDVAELIRHHEQEPQA